MKKQPSEGARKHARALRREMTKAEKKIWQMLRARQTEGYRFRRQVPIGHFIADFACHEARMIVEIDGDQHDPSSESEVRRTRFLEGEGYRVLRFWNSDVLENRDGVVEIIIAATNKPPTRPAAPAAPGVPGARARWQRRPKDAGFKPSYLA